MSATNRSDVRDPEDHYKTPIWATQAILPQIFEGDGRDNDLLDPCAGTGAILDAVRSYRDARQSHDGASGVTVRGLELNAGRVEECRAKKIPCELANALSKSCAWGGPQFVVMNPPFSLAMEFVVKALAEIGKSGTIAVLLRLSWLESAERASFHKAHPADLFVLSSRPSFVASLKCKGRAAKGFDGVVKGCGWHATFDVDGPFPTKCPECDGRVSVTTSDSSAYAWWVWGPGRGNRWFLLDAAKP